MIREYTYHHYTRPKSEPQKSRIEKKHLNCAACAMWRTALGWTRWMGLGQVRERK